MKKAILHGPRDLRIEEHPLDTSALGADEIWVETQISAFKIGTDRGNFEAQNAYRVRLIIRDSLATAIWVLFAVLELRSRALRLAIALWLLSLTNLNTS